MESFSLRLNSFEIISKQYKYYINQWRLNMRSLIRSPEGDNSIWKLSLIMPPEKKKKKRKFPLLYYTVSKTKRNKNNIEELKKKILKNIKDRMNLNVIYIDILISWRIYNYHIIHLNIIVADLNKEVFFFVFVFVFLASSFSSRTSTYFYNSVQKFDLHVTNFKSP